jgi:hypothetical protein
MKINIYKLGFIIIGVGIALLWAGCSYGQYGSVSSVTRRDYKEVFGSSAVTLGSSYTGGGSVSSSAMIIRGMAKYAMNVAYTPKSFGSSLLLLVERSNDHDCTTYYPLSNAIETTDRTNIYNTGVTSTMGTPFVMGGNSGVYASGTTQYASFDFDGIGGCMKVSAKEVTTSTAGTVYADLLMQTE